MPRGPARLLAAAVIFCQWAVQTPAVAAPFEPWPGTRYEPAIPHLQEVVGHDFGAEITSGADVQRYLEALAAAAPERTHLMEYARSWQGRPLHYVVVGNRDNLARLAAIRAGMQRLADPRGASAAELDALVDELPAVVWLAHGVHGDEISSSDAALLTAYHLLAARDDRVSAWLDEVLVVIDPLQNPDGRARFLHHYASLRGLVPQPSPIAAERSQAWPGGRTNHYLFDMNRDWFALTQPEVRGRVQAFLDYYPLVHVDLHEMGTDSTYYFPPPATPYNPFLGDHQRAMLEALGRGAAELFDDFGFRYYTREIFDAYYPGYGDTWPALHGAAGMTFEVASARGLAGQRSDGSLVDYRDGVQRHFIASLATIRTAAAHRQRWLGEFLAQRRSSGDDTAYVLLPGSDPGRAHKLARLLMAQGIEVRQPAGSARLCGTRFAAGSYVVSADQPAGRLAGTLLAPESPADAAFWAEQERRAGKRLPVEVYDVVAWSLPLLYGVPMISCRAAVTGYPLADDDRAQSPAPGEAALAYLVPWGSQAAVRFLAGALQAGLQISSTTQPFTHDRTEYPSGSLILSRAGNAAELPSTVADLARRSAAPVQPVDQSWVDAGVDFGSDRVRRLPAPRIALAWDEPTASYSAGAWRYVVERKLGYPVAPVRVRDLASPWLDQFDVLILPDGDDYAAALDEDAGANLQRWVHRGGTLVGVSGALEFLVSEEAGLLASALERRAGPEGEDADDGAAAAAVTNGKDAAAPAVTVPGSILAGDDDVAAALAPREEPPSGVPGVLLNARVDGDHWLAAGLPERLALMYTGSRILTPLRLDEGVNALTFLAAPELVAAGRLWEASGEQLAHKPAVVVQKVGRGQVIGFVVDPTFRGMMDGLDVLIANVLFLGPGQAGPVPPAPPLQPR